MGLRNWVFRIGLQGSDLGVALQPVLWLKTASRRMTARRVLCYKSICTVVNPIESSILEQDYLCGCCLIPCGACEGHDPGVQKGLVSRLSVAFRKGPFDTVRGQLVRLVVAPAVIVSRGLTIDPWTSSFVCLHGPADGAEFNTSDVLSS